MEINYAVIKIASRRNQQNRIIFEGTKKECKEQFIQITENDKENNYFVAQYMLKMLNRVVMSTKEFTSAELLDAQDFPSTPKVETIIKDEKVDKKTLTILQEKYSSDL